MSNGPDSDSQLPLKRQRTENTDRTDLVRSKIWKSWGDIVLQAESTLFKVNRTVLAQHSSVFEGMFSIPQPQDGETVDCCAVVELSDTAQDVELLLAALYDPFHHQPKQPFEVVACMLRLGRKYEIDQFKDDAVSRIRQAFPNRPEPWGEVSKIEDRAGLVLDLLNLAYETGLNTCIPTLALRCLEYWTLKDLFTGIPRPDGSRAIPCDAIKLTLALGSEAIREAQGRSFRAFLSKEESCRASCGSDHIVSRKRYQYGFRARADKSYTTGVFIYAYLPGFTFQGVAVGTVSLCDKCAQEITTSAEYRHHKTEVWPNLPGFFGLPEWKDLKDTV
ncbi:hypothetical protein FB45DRAFT_780081 [Roridomyces roridus]|uniref:BTB domain-containing protein n=1 Tax=Roridomyces roridus TaxID=1738132 RepID=A0AAD7CKA3_9AGAR|nr:hypothetical protein FB45DRAFT_780081 [Roridomyces roridus]